MKHNNSFIFNYTVVETRSFEIDLEKLADLLIEDEGNNTDITPLIEHFGYNMDVYLCKLGLLEAVEIDEYYYDYLYERIYDDLEMILVKKLQDKQ